MKQIYLPLILSIAFVVGVFVLFENLEGQLIEWLDLCRENKGEYAIFGGLILASDILLPVPSSIIMYMNGIVLGVWQGMLVSFVALMISSVVGYYLGYYSSRLMNLKQNERANSVLTKYGGMGILITRGIPILAESICFTAGYSRMKFNYFLALNAIGYLPICFIYAWFGSLGSDVNAFLYCFFASLFLSFLLFIFGKKLVAQYDVV